MRFPNWAWAAAIVGAVFISAVAQPIYLLVAWHYKIAPTAMSTANELSPLLGTVFTAGGLIIALVAIYSLVNVENVTSKAVESLQEKVPQQVDARIRSFLEAYGDFSRAQDLLKGKDFTRLDEAEELVEWVTLREPDIPGVYAWMGEAFFEATTTVFCGLHDVVAPVALAGFSDFRTPPLESYSSFASKALLWLTRALERNDADRNRLALDLAELSGMLGNFQDTIKWLGLIEAVAREDGLGSFEALFLVGGCQTEHDLKRVGALVKQDLIMTSDDVQAKIASDLEAYPNNSNLFLIALPKAQALKDPPAKPGIVNVRYISANMTGFVSWNAAIKPPGPYMQATYPEPSESGGETKLIPMTELLEWITERFHLVAVWRPN